MRATNLACRRYAQLNGIGSEEAMMANALSDKERALMDAYWRAANYLSVGQIYLYDNPLLKQPLTNDHIKPRLLGHWGTTPGVASENSIRLTRGAAANQNKIAA